MRKVRAAVAPGGDDHAVSEQPEVGERRYVRRSTWSGEVQSNDVLSVEEWDGVTWSKVGKISGAELLAMRPNPDE